MKNELTSPKFMYRVHTGKFVHNSMTFQGLIKDFHIDFEDWKLIKKY